MTQIRKRKKAPKPNTTPQKKEPLKSGEEAVLVVKKVTTKTKKIYY